MTSGIVSTTDRELDTDTATMTGLVQPDASIPLGQLGGLPGQRGGSRDTDNPAVATNSRLVSASNVGFAIDTTRSVVDELTGEAI